MPNFYFEDFVEGAVDIFGSRKVTREEIVAFAAEFDPQPMHLDEEAARGSMLNGLAGSGWHMCALMMRMMYDEFIHETASMGAPGVEELKWLKPMRPDTTLRLRRTVHEKRLSKSRPDMGIVRMTCELLDDSGEPIVRQTYSLMAGRRPGTQR